MNGSMDLADNSHGLDFSACFDYAARGALYFGERTAVVDVEKGEVGRFSYNDLEHRCRRLAAYFAARGVRKGDRIGLLAANGIEYVDLLLCCAKLGAVFVPYNYRMHAAELQKMVSRTSPKILVYGEEYQQHVATLASGVEKPILLAISGSTEPSEPTLCDIVQSPVWEASEKRVSPAIFGTEKAVRGSEDILCLLGTGGTTGLPKSAMISHRMCAHNALTTMIHELVPGDVTIVHTPMFHTGGLLVYAFPLLLSGGKVVIMRKWDVEQFLSLIPSERVTLFFCVPTQYQMLLDSPSLASTSFSSVRFVTSGGAPLPIPVIESFRRIHDVPFKQGFGMTEFGPGCFSMGIEFAQTKAGSIGRPNAFVGARIVDENGMDVAVGVAGELLLSGPALFSGYFQDEEATQNAIDAAGYFHTGDIARQDTDGFFYLVDRKKDMFISGGENVYPVEIEAVLHQHPAVKQCAVIGIPDEKWGQVGQAFVVLRPEAQATAQEALLDFLRAQLARYKVPKRVRFVAELPVSPAGKVLKRELA